MNFFAAKSASASILDEKKTSSSSSATVEELAACKSSVVPVLVPASVKRLMGKRTASQGKKASSKRDGRVYTLQNVPARMFRPVSRGSGAIFRITQETLTGSALTTSNVSNTFAAFNFTVASLDQISSLTALFDQYRIVQIEVWICPQATVVGPSQLASVIDYDDSSNLSTFAQALDYVNVVSCSGDFAQYRTWRPHVAMAAYSGAFSSFANVTSPWIDAVSTGVQHYGLKLAASTAPTNTTTFDITTRLHTQWRNVR
jgi:hypothetical protein